MIPYDLSRIKALVFDVDGVLSRSTIPMDEDGEPQRTMNVKDGYALKQAVNSGIIAAIITGGADERIIGRYRYLGLRDIYMGCHIKMKAFQKFIKKHNLAPADILYMGDDIPDLEVMQAVGCPVCPADACPEIKQVSCYVSQATGGNGCVRDVVEQVLKAKGLWLHNAEAFGW